MGERAASRADMAFARMGKAASGLAWPAVAARIASARGGVGPIAWSEDGLRAAALVASSAGGEGYMVSLWMRRSRDPAPKGERVELLWSEGGDGGWAGYSSCGCGFFAESHAKGACKHVGALAEMAGEQAKARAEARSIAASAPLPAGQKGKPAPRRGL